MGRNPEAPERLFPEAPTSEAPISIRSACTPPEAAIEMAGGRQLALCLGQP